MNAKTDEYGSTSLHVAAEHGHTEVVKLLLEGKADVDACRVQTYRWFHSSVHCFASRDRPNFVFVFGAEKRQFFLFFGVFLTEK